jgi:hypothetical protein
VSTYLTGYNGTTRNRADFLIWLKGQRIEPELERRVIAIIDASIVAGRPLGVGSARRGKIAADNLFRSRYHIVPVWVPGAVKFEGSWWKLNAGAAPAMPSDRTYHVCMTPQSWADPDADGLYCLAIDFIGDLAFLAEQQSRYGLNEFTDENGERWHGQGREYPSARSRYVYGTAAYDPLPRIVLPGELGVPAPAPAPLKVFAPLPTLRQRTRTDLLLGRKNDPLQVRALQLACNFWGWRDSLNRTLIVDNDFGSKTAQAVMAMQRVLGATVDGVYGPQSALKLQGFLNYMAALASKGPA